MWLIVCAWLCTVILLYRVWHDMAAAAHNMGHLVIFAHWYEYDFEFGFFVPFCILPSMFASAATIILRYL